MATRIRSSQDMPIAAPGRRERNKQEKRARIVSAARRLFDTKGFHETTTQEIAQCADIGAGTLFLYAKSKEDLLVMVFRDEMIETSQAAFDTAPRGAALADQLMHIFGRMIVYHDRDRALARILLKEIMFTPGPERREEVQALMRVIYGGLARIIEAGQAAGDLRRGADPWLAAQNLFAVYYMSLITWLGGVETPARLTDSLRAKLVIAIDGLKPVG